MEDRATELDAELDADEGNRVVTLTIPAKPEYITLSRLALTGLSHVRPLAEETLAELKLALTEATSNSVRHAYADGEGRVHISFELCEDRLVVEVSDDGSGFPQTDESARREEELSEGGLGIAIIRSIADEFVLDSEPQGGSRLRFVKRL